MTSARALSLLIVGLALLLGAGPLAVAAQAEEAGGVAEWRLEQPLPPELPDGQKPSTPVGLGKIGDIEFWAPNRGLLITDGVSPTIPPGVWVYNGQEWHQLTGEGPDHEGVCGATDGRIAWAGPNEFWTVSDGRPGQISSEKGLPPLEDDTLCHFANGQVVGSYASPAFEATSYTAMHAAGCLGSEDCWFAGEPLAHVGAFHLHWNGQALVAEPNPQGRAVESMSAFEGDLYEGVRIEPPQETHRSEETHEEEEEITPPETGLTPAALHLILPAGESSSSGTPFVSLEPGIPNYGEEEPPWTLEALQLSAAEGNLWGVANPLPRSSFPAAAKVAAGEVTIVHNSGGSWRQVLGATSDPPSGNPFTKFIARREEPTQEELREERANLLVSSITAEPGGEGAWLALDSPAEADGATPAPATVAYISNAGTVSEEQQLPSSEEPYGAKGLAERITCPAPHDCWMATSEGWLFHLAPADERQLPKDNDPAFEKLINYRPPDQGIPQVVPDAPPPDDSGLLGERPAQVLAPVTAVVENETKVPVPLLSDLHSKLLHGHTLQLSFHLAVKARVQLLAMRRKALVASTPTRTLASGNRKLLLALNPKRWPTKLDLKTHALAPLPLTSTRSPSVNTVSTSLAFPDTRGLLGSGLLP